MNDRPKTGARNLAEAAKWYRKSAEQSNPDAMAALARLYFSGDGVTADYAQAAVWYTKLAEGGDTQAQYLLGYIYESGKNGVSADLRKAARWYQPAADKGNALAQFHLGRLFFEGKGVASDAVIGYMWSNLAAAALWGEARIAAERQRDYIASQLTPEQQSKAQQMARDWKPASAAQQ